MTTKSKAKGKAPKTRQTGTQFTKVTDTAILAPVASALPQTGVPGMHLKALGIERPATGVDPIEWAKKVLEAHAPDAALEKIWQLKFGNDNKRDSVASEILAMGGLGAKRADAGPPVQPAIVLIQPASSPWAQVVTVTPNTTTDSKPQPHGLPGTGATGKAGT